MVKELIISHWNIGGVIARAQVADGFLSRLAGLLGNRRGLQSGEGLLLTPCSSIHTFGMAFPIDVVFLSPEGRVVSLFKNISPWRVIPSVPGAEKVLELPVGAIDEGRLIVGELLMMELNKTA